jgi:hypothetical protein
MRLLKIIVNCSYFLLLPILIWPLVIKSAYDDCRFDGYYKNKLKDMCLGRRFIWEY